MADRWTVGLGIRGIRDLVFGFVLTSLFIPGIDGAGTTPRWAFAAVVLPLLLKPVRLTGAHIAGLALLCWGALSVAWSHPFDGLDALVKLVIAAEAFWFGSQLDDIKPTVIGFGLGVWVSSLLMLFDAPIPVAEGNAGLFVNSNLMGETAALILVAVVWQRVWWLVPGILPALWLAQSRGAWLAVAVAGLPWLWRQSKMLVVGVLLIVPAVAMYWLASPSAHYRLQMYEAVEQHLTWFGSGLGSFYSQFPSFNSGINIAIMRPEYLHNDWLQMVFELGIGALLIVPLLWFCWSSVVVALIVEGCFGFPLHTPATLVFGFMIAGFAGRKKSYWSIESERAMAHRAASFFYSSRVA